MSSDYRNKKRPKKKVEIDDYQPQGDPKILTIPLENIGLSEPTLSALKNGNINTIKDVASKTLSQLYKIQRIGKKNCLEISKCLSPYSLDIRQEENPNNSKPKDAIVANANAKKNQPNASVEIQKNDKEQNIKVKFKNNQNNKTQQNNIKVVKSPHDNNKNVMSKFNDNISEKSNNIQNKNSSANINKNLLNINKQLNDTISKKYAGWTINEIILGKRMRPASSIPEKEILTPASIVKFCRKGKWGFKDWKGNVLIPPTYDEVFSFSEGLACVEKNQKLGFIDKKNNLVIDYKYDSATSFSDGVASVSIGEKSGYINQKGEIVIDIKYDIATCFHDGKGVIKLDNRWGVISLNGEIFWR